MSFDDRIIIKQRFEYKGLARINTLKLIENDEFVQLYVNSGDNCNRAHFRLYPQQLKELKEFLEKVEISACNLK